MKTPVIDSLAGITIFGNAGSTPELTAISGDSPDKADEAMDAMEQLVRSLALDYKIYDRTVFSIMDMGSEIFSHGEECGFRRGFRVATRLMAESLLAPETGGRTEA